MQLSIAQHRLDLAWPHIMGILNVTPDSFSDGGRFVGRDSALRQAEQMLHDGASIIDIGGESTRPGAQAVCEQEELDRVIPVIEAVAELGAAISVDTSKAAVMRSAVAAGAGMINDVNALLGEGTLATAARLDVPVCLMHMQGQPRSMQQQPVYGDVVEEVGAFLEQRAKACIAAGMAREHIVLDPGFGFGKTVQHNLQLLQKLEQLHKFAYPLLVGLSRKSMLGVVTGKPVAQRLAGSLSAAVIAAVKGAQIIRVHDVDATRDALKVVYATQMGENYHD